MKLKVVTPAGRERYMRLLSHYVLGSPEVVEWQLWDNCRNASDRAYLQQLAASDPRCVIKRLPSADGSSRNIGDFFRFCDDTEALYLRLDDDIVFTEPGFFEKFKARVLAQRGQALWFAPLIVNNAVCSALIQNLSKVRVEGTITMQAMDPFSWAHASFPIAMHPVLIEAAKRGRLGDFRVPDREVRAGRFSINAIAFFGDEIKALGDLFQPPDQNEEEWYSAVLPMRLDRPGKVLGDLLVSHFSFYTQERELLETSILEEYYGLAGLAWDKALMPVEKRRGLRLALWKWRMAQQAKRRDRAPVYRISLAD